MVDSFYNKVLFNYGIKTQVVRETAALTTVFAPSKYMLSRALILWLHKAASQFAKSPYWPTCRPSSQLVVGAAVF